MDFYFKIFTRAFFAYFQELIPDVCDFFNLMADRLLCKRPSTRFLCAQGWGPTAYYHRRLTIYLLQLGEISAQGRFGR